MIKGIILGVALVLALVGYGVINTSTLEEAGTRVKTGVNYLASAVDDATR